MIRKSLLLLVATFGVLVWNSPGIPVLAQDDSADLIERAAKFSEEGNNSEALKLIDAAIQKAPTEASAYYVRGRVRFRKGEIRNAVEDFDRYIELRPAVAARQWERGIACYYARLYKEGAKQFEDYQKFDGHDVENSVWRYLCQVPQVGVERAQAEMLPIENDRRIPMMQIYELYRGKLKPAEVLSAVESGDPSAAMKAGRLFYAHLYLGLWYEVQGNKAEAKRYIDLAASDQLRENPHINRYMWDVARIHQKLIRGELKQ